jgi:flagellar motor switch protein FliN/FliY
MILEYGSKLPIEFFFSVGYLCWNRNIELMDGNAVKQNIPPYSPQKEIESILLELNQIPLVGAAPKFDFASFSAEIGKIFSITGLKIEPSELSWRTADVLTSGLSTPLIVFRTVFSPLDGCACLLMGEQEATHLMHWVLLKETGCSIMEDPDLHKGFTKFFALEVLQTLEKMRFCQGLVPRLLEDTSIPTEPMLCQEIRITYGDESAEARLCVNKALVEGWAERFGRKQPAPLTSEIASKIQVDAAFKIGSTPISLEEWKQVKLGDLVLLEQCSVDPKTMAGEVYLTLAERPLMKGTLKDSKITIAPTAKPVGGQAKK